MLSAMKRLYLPLLLSAIICGPGCLVAVNAQTSFYVPITFSKNPILPGQQVSVGSTLDTCLSQNQIGTGSLAIYVNTKPSGTGTYFGRDFGTGIGFNSIDEGDQFYSATYYFYGYYTPGTPAGGTDPCLNAVTHSSSPQWATLQVVAD